MSKKAEQDLASFMEPLPQWLRKVLWYEYSSMTDLEAHSWCDSINPLTEDMLEELKRSTNWQPERYPQTADELRPKFEIILLRCDRKKWNAYRQNIDTSRAMMADQFIAVPKSPIGAPRKDDIAEEGARLMDEGLKWGQAAIRLGTTKENLRSLIRSRRKNSSQSMVKTNN